MAYQGEYDGTDEEQAMEWIEDVLDTPMDEEPLGELLPLELVGDEFEGTVLGNVLQEAALQFIPLDALVLIGVHHHVQLPRLEVVDMYPDAP